MQLFPYYQILTALGMSDDTWGFIIFRTAYGAEYDRKFQRALEILDGRVKRHAYAQHTKKDGSMLTDADRKEIGDGVMAKYQNLIFNDEETFSNASVESLCHHLLAWMYELDAHTDDETTYGVLRLTIFSTESIDAIINWQATEFDLLYLWADPHYNLRMPSWYRGCNVNRCHYGEVYDFMINWGSSLGADQHGGLADWDKARDDSYVRHGKKWIDATPSSKRKRDNAK